MQLINFRRVAIKSLKLPGDMKDRMHKRHVIDLAASIEALGGEPASAPLVQNGTRLLIAGRDRVAACMINKTPRIWVRIVDADKGELARLELDENLHRRQDNRERMLAQSVKVEEARIRAEADEKVLKDLGGTGVPKTKPAAVKKAAREAVAKKAGVKVESVRKAEQRQSTKEKAKDAPPKAEKPVIETMGIEIGKDLTGVVARIAGCMHELEQLSKLAQRNISLVAGVLPAQVVVRLMDIAKQLGAEARACTPSHLCPKCKGEGDDKCPVCKGAHYAREEQMKDIPKEWLIHPPKNGVQGEA